MSPIKHEIRHFHVVVVQKRKRNVQKVSCTCKVVLLLIKPIAFMKFPLPSPSSDLKVPIMKLLVRASTCNLQGQNTRTKNPSKPLNTVRVIKRTRREVKEVT